MQPTGRKELSPIVFIRAICTLGIVCYHFCWYSKSALSQLVSFANGYVGEMLVTVFFVMSGAVLYYNHPQVEKPIAFYKKRARSIYPGFYLCFGFFYLVNVLTTKCLFYLPDVAPWKLLFSLLGVDGYLLDTGLSVFAPNWYLVGEWFLGALLLLYLVYPLLCRGLQTKTTTLCTAGAAVLLFLLQAFADCFLIKGFRGFFSCLFAFLAGMLLIRHQKVLLRPTCIAAAGLVFLILLLVKLPLPSALVTNLCGIACFLLLYGLGSVVMKGKVSERLSRYVAGISFPVFLLQHKLIGYVQTLWNPDGIGKALAILGLTILLIFAFAQILQAATKAMLAAWPFRRKNA